MVEYNNEGKVSSVFGIDIKQIFEELEQNIFDLDDKVLDGIKKINKKIDELIPDKKEDSNPNDAV